MAVQVFFLGNALRLVLAKSLNAPSVMLETIWREAPFSEDFGRLPRLADKAAPAAICCFFDFAGISH
jgi:hypothetical protein